MAHSDALRDASVRNITRFNKQRAGDVAAAFVRAERVAKIAIGRAFGLTRSQLGVLLGVSLKTIEAVTHKHRAFIDAVEQFARDQMPKPEPIIDADGEVLDLNPQTYTAELNNQLGLCAVALRRAVKADNMKLVMQAVTEIHKVVGLTNKLKVEHGGKVEHNHKVVPAGLLSTVNAPHLRRGQAPITVTAVKKADDHDSAS